MEGAMVLARSSDLPIKTLRFKMLSNQQIQNNWPQIKSQVLSKWNKLSEAEVEKTHGDSHSLETLVNSKYDDVADFDATYERICNTTSASKLAKNDIENRPATAPSAEAGMNEHTTEALDDTFHAGSPERRANANYAKVENDHVLNREVEDELSAYSTGSRADINDVEADPEFTKLNYDDSSTQFTAPDEFTPSQDPSPSREDITLGRNTSSATKISTAQAAPNSSEASNDAKKKI
jgi:DNA helicase IV